LETTPAILEETVRGLLRQRYSIVAMDELLDLMARGRSAAKVAVLTFDDGYADAETLLLPLLETLRVPFTIYLTTGYPDRTLFPWWYQLEELVLSRWNTPAQREAAFLAMARPFEEATPAEARALGVQLFGAAAVQREADRLFLSWSQVQRLARHPLVTIGAHTMTHPVLSKLGRAAAIEEMTGSRRIIEKQTGLPCPHFAYPFGCEPHAARREFELARECGFASAVTARFANVFAGTPTDRIPRISGATAKDIEIAASGALSVLRYGPRRVRME
jgi:peptidoglycan/xylan/chitin deacetylase (PgdA/CDA1 family)